MNTKILGQARGRRLVFSIAFALAMIAFANPHAGAAVIVNVVETGGDNEATDTILPKWTGVTWNATVAGEPVPGIAVGTPFTVPPFGNNAPSYVDRNHRWTGASATVPIPSYLVGGEYIMEGNDNRDNAGLLLDITVNSQVRCYLLIDNRLSDASATTPPTFDSTHMQWVINEGWTPVMTGVNRTGNAAMPDEIGIDESADGTINNWNSIYSKDFPPGTFRIKQADNTGNNMYGVVIVSIAPATPPAAPNPVAALSLDGQVTLSWTNVATATGYIIKRSSGTGGPYSVIGSTAATTFTDSPLANGVDYFYVVSATNSVGESTNSNEVVAHPNPIVTGITAEGGATTIALLWDALGGATSYSVLRSTSSNGTYTVVASGLGASSYLDTNPPTGTTLYYRISAALPTGPSGQSDTVAAHTAPGVPVVTATLFAATVIRAGWSSDPIVSGFAVERSTDGVNFSPLANTAGTDPSYTNTSLAPSTTYFYRVQAMNDIGSSPFSAIASNTTPAFGINVNFAAGTGNSTGDPVPPAPDGYLVDIGDVYGDRGNGFSYGWDRSIVPDGRYRRAANSPDLRYDTFLHMIKATPPAIWNVALPNGFYSVHIVAGDPANVDSVFQFNVEGALTPTVTPGGAGSFRTNWADFTVAVGVSDGQLTVTSGPNSQTTANNNKIDFIDIYPAVPVKPAFTVQPQDTTIEQNRPVALSATVTGSAVLQFQWYHGNNTPVSDATNAALSFARPQPGDSGTYYLIVTNYGGAATSAPVTLTVTPDTVGPHIVSVGSLDGVNVGVCFDEEIDITSGGAQELGNYSINGGAFNVIGLTFRPDGKSVNLLIDGLLTGAFTVDTLDIPDYAGNINSSTSNGQVLGFTAQDVGGPALPGSSYTCDGNTIEIVGGGADIWGNADQGYLATRPVSGDFDTRVRVIDLRGSNTITKAVLTARESRNPDSAGVTMSVNPAGGRNQVEAGIRPTTGAATAAVGTSFIPAGVPNAWMRISRVGNLFTAYRSTNGLDWVALGQTNIALATDMQVGIGVTAHDNTLLATGTFSGFAISQTFPDLGITGAGSPDPVTVGNNVTYSFVVTNSAADPATDVKVTDQLPAGLSFVSATAGQGSCANVGGTVTCDLGTVAGATQVPVTIVATATTAGAATNTASVATSAFDQNMANNATTVIITVNAGAAQSPIVNFGFTGDTFGGAIQTQNGATYTVQFKDDLNAATWSTLTTIIGDGTVKTFSDPGPTVGQRFYRIVTP